MLNKNLCFEFLVRLAMLVKSGEVHSLNFPKPLKP
jgi:hypothetical protein